MGKSTTKKPVNNLIRLAKWLSQVTITDNGCWEYHPEKYNDYVAIKVYKCDYFNSSSTQLHRFVYAVVYDQFLTPQNVIMHKCDNRICINPYHLQLGTIQENNADRTKKQRKKNQKG